MNSTLHITSRRRLLVLAVATALAAILTASALAVDRPAASFYTKKQLEAISQSWAARGGVFPDRPAASFYTPQQLEAISRSWAARGGIFYDRPSGTTLTSARGFDWGDFGIGAAAMLGLVLLGTGVAAGAHYSRRGGARPRPAS